MDALMFKGLPMPPSSNNQYIPIWSMKRMRPSKELTDFKNAMQVWALTHADSIRQARELISTWTGVRISCVFEFPFEKILTKDGRPLRLDVTNRLKAFHDCLTDALGFDDKWIVAEACEKAVGKEMAVHVTLQNAVLKVF